jgi:GGDEF domain-containing protein
MNRDRLSRAATAAEQLSSALWEVLREQADSGDASAAEALARRLIEVCESFGAVAAAGGVADSAGRAPGADERAGRDRSAVSPGERSERVSRERGADGESYGAEDVPRGEVRFEDRYDEFDPSRLEGSSEGVVQLGLVEPIERREPDSQGPDVGSDFGPHGSDIGEHDDLDPLRAPRGDQVPPFAAIPTAALVDEYEDDSTPIAVKDVRASGHPPVTAAVQRRLERHALDGAPFSVLLVEVLDVERLQALRSGGEVLREIWGVESAIAEQLRPADTLLREIDGRWWLIAPDTDALAALQLAERLAATARRFAHRGAPLRVVIGIAVCPDHGLDAATLIGHADVDLYAAQAAGRSIGGGFEDEPRPA